MNKQTFYYFCEMQFSMFGIPMRIIEGNKIIETYEHLTLDDNMSNIIISDLYSEIFSKNESVISYYISPHLLSYGFVKDAESGLSLLIGPSRSVTISDRVIKEMVLNYGFYLSNTKELSRYINAIPLMQVGRFAQLLSLINTSLNHDILQTKEFYNAELEYKIDPKANKYVLEHNEKIVYGEIHKHNAYDFEQRLVFFVKNGMTNNIKKHWAASLKFKQFSPSSNLVREAKNSCILSIAVISRAAMSGGLESETAYELCDIYMNQVEMCPDLESVMNLKYNILIDFSERVRSLQIKVTDNPAINRTIAFIIENVEKKILSSDIADMLNINSGYLSTKFKESTGMALPDFVNLQKVNEAKKLLLFTDKPLVEISTYLSFSSQSYFQKIFKNFTNLTPTEYRNQADYKDHI